jgi:hypothetical protein
VRVKRTGALSIVPTGAPRMLRRFQIGARATSARWLQSGWIWSWSGGAHPLSLPVGVHSP